MNSEAHDLRMPQDSNPLGSPMGRSKEGSGGAGYRSALSGWGVDTEALGQLLARAKSDSKAESARASALLAAMLTSHGISPAVAEAAPKWDADELEAAVLQGLERREKRRLLEEANILDHLASLLPSGALGGDCLAGVRALRSTADKMGATGLMVDLGRLALRALEKREERQREETYTASPSSAPCHKAACLDEPPSCSPAPSPKPATSTCTFESACESGDLERMQHLVGAGMVDMSMPFSARHGGAGGQTPMMVAARHGHAECVEWMLALMCDVDTVDAVGATALMHAVSSCGVSSGNLEVIRLLISAGADPHVADKNKCTPLLDAARSGNTRVMRILMGEGVKMESDINGRTPIGEAAAHGHLEAVAVLLNYGADANEVDEDGDTPLMKAAGKGHVEIMSMLIGENAHVDGRNEDGKTALMFAAFEGRCDAISLLIKEGASVNTCDMSCGFTPLLMACSRGFSNAVAVLVAAGADWEASDEWGRRGLMSAAGEGHIEVVSFLVGYGADVHARDDDGDTALIEAASGGHVDCASVLIDSGADVNVSSNCGRTALMWAVAQGHEDVVSILLENGADVHGVDQDGVCVIARAAEEGNFEIVELLRRYQ
mmetsp:Transcript_21104/g.41010  ORF Transcript_21104/g.41010 Transcript_21104/m.41010 type:complete len:607 (+) Transcript_21104:222-2042(+)